MTVSDLLNQLAYDSGDSSSDYTDASRRWLNLTRSYIAGEAMWRRAMRPVATITTSAATTTGLYNLQDGSQKYEFVAGDVLFDETNDNNIVHESMLATRMVDQAKETTGQPTVWADAGDNGSGIRQIYLWPIPDGTYTITFPGYVLIEDLTANNDNDVNDPFFGPILPWGACFSQGMRFFHDQNNNEMDPTSMLAQERRFQRLIERRKAQDRISPTERMAMAIVKTQVLNPGEGRFDPSHFSNRRAW